MRMLIGLVGTAILLVLSAFEIYHDLIAQQTWPGFTLRSNNVAYVLVPVWVWGAVSLWSQKFWAYLGVIFATMATLLHGLVVATGGANEAILFLLLTPVIAGIGILSKYLPRQMRESTVVALGERTNFSRRVS
ncbi:MAG: hypothetical protein AB7F59_03245 [Bdellovibrionales bacterium]